MKRIPPMDGVIRAARNAPAVQYFIVQDPADTDRCLLRRDLEGRQEYWTGVFYGWQEAGRVPPKAYDGFGRAKLTLRLLQDRDREHMTAKSRAAFRAKMAPQIEEALRELMNYVGGWDAPVTHPCGKAAALLRALDRGY